jgi:hypothetical protein
MIHIRNLLIGMMWKIFPNLCDILNSLEIK